MYSIMADLDDGSHREHVHSREYAVSLDAQDPLRHMRREFFIPSKAELKYESLLEAGTVSLIHQIRMLKGLAE